MNYRQLADTRKMRPEEELYIALYDLDFSWYGTEIEEVIAAWNAGEYISDIAAKVDRVTDEIVVLIMSLARENRVQLREGGVYGDID